MRPRHLLVAAALTLASPAPAQDLSAFEDVPLPVGAGAREPSLFAAPDGRLLMSWTEPSGSGYAVRMATLAGGTWSGPHDVTVSPDLFVNWADFPSVSAFADGTLAVHWLQRSGRSGYAYDALIALSRDGGASWGPPAVPHRDGTQSQNGFVSLVPVAESMVAVWLDGRAYDGALLEDGALPGRMQLRAAVLSADRAVTPDAAIDLSTCSCCQTDAAVAGDTVLVAYRDRSPAEIRDISLVRLRGGEWSAPVPVHADNWEIPGCPVNGPSIAARGDAAVVAWFTAAGDQPAVKIAFSGDRGESFGDAVRVDRGQPVGRVDALLSEDGSALVSWVEWDGQDEALLICRATTSGCESTRRIAVNAEGNSMNFPRMAMTSDGLYLAWTQPLPDGSDSIRMVRSPR